MTQNQRHNLHVQRIAVYLHITYQMWPRGESAVHQLGFALYLAGPYAIHLLGIMLYTCWSSRYTTAGIQAIQLLDLLEFTLYLRWGSRTAAQGIDFQGGIWQAMTIVAIVGCYAMFLTMGIDPGYR